MKQIEPDIVDLALILGSLMFMLYLAFEFGRLEERAKRGEPLVCIQR